MDCKTKTEDFEDPDYFVNIKNAIDVKLANIQKIVNSISQLRGESSRISIVKHLLQIIFWNGRINNYDKHMLPSG